MSAPWKLTNHEINRISHYVANMGQGVRTGYTHTHRLHMPYIPKYRRKFNVWWMSAPGTFIHIKNIRNNLCIREIPDCCSKLFPASDGAVNLTHIYLHKLCRYTIERKNKNENVLRNRREFCPKRPHGFTPEPPISVPGHPSFKSHRFLITSLHVCVCDEMS